MLDYKFFEYFRDAREQWYWSVIINIRIDAFFYIAVLWVGGGSIALPT